MENTGLWAKRCMVKVVLDGLQAEVRTFTVGCPAYSMEVTVLFQQAYRHASALSAVLHRLEEVLED